MVWARLAAVLAVIGVAARAASGLSLGGVRGAHGPPRPLSLPPHRRLAPRDPADLMPRDQALALLADPDQSRYEDAAMMELDTARLPSYRMQHLISELAEAIVPSNGLEEGEGGDYGDVLPEEVAEAIAEGFEGVADGRPLPAEVAEALLEAEAGAVLRGGMAGPWESRDQRYNVLTQYLPRTTGQANNNNNNNINNNNINRKAARDSRNSRSITTTNNNNNTTTNTGTSTTLNDNHHHHQAAAPHTKATMFKRAWPHSFSRRRNTGLSLSIDASMKVLREALYLEIARKKQRQQVQRAQHNKALLNTIGKRDVASQLVGVATDGTLDQDRN